MSSYALGYKVLRKLCAEQNPLEWQRAKLNAKLFKAYDLAAFQWVENHLNFHHVLPQVETLEANFPEIKGLEVIEPASYYVKLLEAKYFYEVINKANIDSQAILKNNQDDHDKALDVLQKANSDILHQKYRLKLMDFGAEGYKTVMDTYLKVHGMEITGAAIFGWPYMDTQFGGAMPGDVISFVGRPATGKAQPLDAKVLTKDGFKRMGDLVLVGETLAATDSRLSVITGIYPQGLKPVYQLEFQDGRSVEASDEHLWEVWYREWESPRILTTVQLIAKLKVKRYKNRLSIRLFDGEYGDSVKSLFSPWLLGVLLGDGGFTARDYIRLSSADPSIIARASHELRMEGLELKHNSYYDYSIMDCRMPSNNRMKKWISDFGLRYHRSEEKFIPAEYLNADKNTRLELLRGLLDTDGTSETTGGVSFSSSSKRLAEEVLYLVRSLGGKAKLGKIKETKCLPHYRVHIVCKNRAELFTLVRKQERVTKDRTTHTNHRLVLKSISYVGDKECQCISVSHPTNLYVTDNFVVTHNTWMTLWTALKNWKNGQNVLFVSMEMMTLPIAQRVAAMYTESNISQLKTGGYSSPSYKKFAANLKCLSLEKSKFYIIDGNLAASAEDIFVLADFLQCQIIVIDGAYLLRHKNAKLDRFTRVAENTELIKRHTTDNDSTAICSWQFNRTASQKQKKGAGTGQNSSGDLEDIGMTDNIGQLSSIVLGLFQEEGIETMQKRTIKVLKGRNGEIGQFSIAWDFNIMDFSQVDPPISGVGKSTNEELQWV